jgi:hypothetical protein
MAEFTEAVDDGHPTIMDLFVRRRHQEFLFEHPQRGLEGKENSLLL